MNFMIINESEMTCMLLGPTDKNNVTGALTIPEEVNDYTVTTIGNYAFDVCNKSA